MGILTLLTALVFVARAAAYSAGPPVSVCTTMSPNHGGSSQSMGFSLTLGGATEYTPGGQVTVTAAPGGIQGILLQARVVGTTTVVGSWATGRSADYKLMNCGQNGDTISHARAGGKSPVLVWTAPSTNVGNIEFVATMVEAKLLYQENIKSSALPPAQSGWPSTTTTAGGGKTTGSGAGITAIVVAMATVITGHTRG